MLNSRFIGRKRVGGRPVGRKHVARPARLLCVLAVSFASIAALVPAAATATSKSKLISEAKASMAAETKAEEKDRIIPYKQSAVFTVNCSVSRGHVLCREHVGPKRCVNGKPWMELSDIFPVIKGRVGLSLTDGALVVTSVYCKAG
jgi:hypothetical protein